MPTPDTIEHDIGDEQDAAFYDLIALGDAQLALEDLARFDQEEREAAAAKAEKEAREQAERERAEREAALAEAVSWVRGVSAGYNPGSVATYAREEFGVDDPAEQLEEEYRAAAQQRLATAAWLAG